MKFAMGIDNIHGHASDKALLDECVKIVESKGHTVTNLGVGPSVVQNYSLRNSSDVMVQIAGGMCVGTLADFVKGMTSGYYKAQKGCIPIYTKGWTKLDPTTWKATRAWDDKFSYGLNMSDYLGKTLPTIYSEKSSKLLPFAHGKSAQEMMDMMLGGGSATNTGAATGGGGGGSSAFDLIKQVVTPWDKYGVALQLDGNTLTVTRATTKNAPVLHENMILNDSISITDYASDSVNYISDGKNVYKDDFLVKRFGKIEPEEKPENKGKVWIRDMYQIAQRESGHSIDCKVLFDPKLHEGMYVHLQLPSFELDGYYFVSKTSVEEDNCMSITLDPAPPSRYQEVTETTVDAGKSGDTGMGKDAVSIGKALYSKYKFAAKLAQDPGQVYKGCETYSCMKEKGNGSCWAWAEALYEECNKAGIKARIIQYRSCSWVSNHRSTQIYQNGQWVDYPYSEAGISKWAKATKYKGGMFVYKQPP